MYYHVHLEVFNDDGMWAIRLNDPLNHMTVNNENRDATRDAAKETALTMAHGYLTTEYPEQQWPSNPARWVDLG